MEPQSWCLVWGPEIHLIQKSSKSATKSFHKIAKKLDFCLYFNFISLLFASVIEKIIIKREKKNNNTVKQSNHGRIIISADDFTG